MLDAVDALGRDHAAALSAVEGIGLSGQMHGAVLLDDDGRRAASRHPVERCSFCRRMRRVGGRVPNPPAGDRQYRHARLHRAQAAVGAQARAGRFRPGAHRAAAESLYPLSA